MTSTFVTVPAEKFAEKFTAAGFKPSASRTEVVYERPHNDPRYTIKVYTSLSLNAAETRGVGADAIRVCLVFTGKNGKTVGVGKATRVNRTGSVEGVLERTIERAREMWALANESSRTGVCKCGALKWADSGRCTARCNS